MQTINDNRYDTMPYRRAGKSGLKLPAISLGLWQNFGLEAPLSTVEELCYAAFNCGITHFDLANNYGHPYNGTAEENFGRVLARGLRAYRDELCISTKAGYEMWEGPYGDRNGSRKYLIASLDQSLRRMGLDYVDIYYHHIYDPNTPLWETALALDQVVRQGKALYVGISNYSREQTARIQEIFQELHTPFILNQPSYSLLNRHVEEDRLDEYCLENGIGLAVFSPLAQGLLTDRYLHGIPEDSRYAKGRTSLVNQALDEPMLRCLTSLNELAKERGQKLSQMALAYLLHNEAVATVLVGVSRPEQLLENVKAAEHTEFTADELARISELLTGIS